MYTLGNLEIKNEGNKPDKNNVRAFLDYAIGKVEDIELDVIVIFVGLSSITKSIPGTFIILVVVS